MKKLLFALPALLLFISCGMCSPAMAQDSGPMDEVEYYDNSALSDAPLLSQDELDDLLAPIALYPDPLIAQILPAATFVDQVDEAARYVREYGRAARIDDQPWDVSVKAIAHYPDVLFMMDQKYDWTVALGQAYIEQPQDVMDAIQWLRQEAEAAGNLYSTPQQQVVVEPEAISIVPASPEYIYVPVYDPNVVYYESYSPAYPFITFSAGLLIGAWLSRDCDWHSHRIYYHGWRGGGWVGRVRPHIRDRRGIYVNPRYSEVRVNRRVLEHHDTRFRQELRTESARRREGRPVVANPRQRPNAERPRRERPGAAAPSAPAPAPVRGGERPPAGERPERQRQEPQHRQPGTPSPAPAVQPSPKPQAPGTPSTTKSGMRDLYRGRDVQQRLPASQSGYGGYGTSQDANVYRQRGQASRGLTPAVQPRAVVPRPVAPQSHPAPAAPAIQRSAPVQHSAPAVQRSAPAVQRPATSAPRQSPPAAGGRDRR
ncbi:hypothetical protein GMSM_21080 [Geomonas sp. Red276]